MPGAEWLELLCKHIPDRYEHLAGKGAQRARDTKGDGARCAPLCCTMQIREGRNYQRALRRMNNIRCNALRPSTGSGQAALTGSGQAYCIVRKLNSCGDEQVGERNCRMA
jgi:hypothetical protein